MVHSLSALSALLLLLVAGGAHAADAAVEAAPVAAAPSAVETATTEVLAEAPTADTTDTESAADPGWDAFLATLPDEGSTAAAGDSALTEQAASTVGKPTTDLGRAGLATLIAFLVLAAMFAIPSTRRRLLARLLQRPSAAGAVPLEIDLRGARALGSGQRVVALEVDGVRLLVGISPSRMDVLHTWWSGGEPAPMPPTPAAAVAHRPVAAPEAAAVVERVLAERRSRVAEPVAPTSSEMIGAWRRAPKAAAPVAPPADEIPWWLEGATEIEQTRLSQTLAEDAATEDVLRRVRSRVAASSAAPKPAPAKAPAKAGERALPATGTDGIRQAARFVLLLTVTFLVPALLGFDLADAAEPALRFEVGGAETGGSPAIKLLATLTLMAVAPALVLAMTSFTRLIVVFSLLRQAVGVQQAPPNQVLIGLALFLTWFIMGPTFTQVHEQAVTPWMAGELTEGEALDEAMGPMRTFMFRNTREQDLGLFLRLDKSPRPATRADVPSRVLVPSFLISELKTAFTIGFLLYIPFLVIDIVVATVLLAMGMMVLPPVVISLPFKLLLFVFVDGWNLLVGSLVGSFA